MQCAHITCPGPLHTVRPGLLIPIRLVEAQSPAQSLSRRLGFMSLSLAYLVKSSQHW